MTVFVVVSLYLFAALAALGLTIPFLLSARARKPQMAILASVIAAWVIVTLISAAVML